MNPKDLTSSNESRFSMMRQIFNSKSSSSLQTSFQDSSSYIEHKKMIATGKQSLNSNVRYFTHDNKREVSKAKQLLRSRGSGIPKKMLP